MRKIFLPLARLFAWLSGSKVVVIPVPDNVLESAKLLCLQMKPYNASGEYKRHQVLRGLMNRHPEEKEKVLALSIEIACLG
jgi:hypothetical protein